MIWQGRINAISIVALFASAIITAFSGNFAIFLVTLILVIASRTMIFIANVISVAFGGKPLVYSDRIDIIDK